MDPGIQFHSTLQGQVKDTMNKAEIKVLQLLMALRNSSNARNSLKAEMKLRNHEKKASGRMASQEKSSWETGMAVVSVHYLDPNPHHI